MIKRNVPMEYLLRPEEAAQILGVSRATLYQLIRAGKMPSVKIGRSRRIHAEALRKWVTQHETLDVSAAHTR